uniref:Uncharacterized protein n=1 Tax=Octopus bimaculoides TaxID=37653 RepID=A0A0L8G3D2_OCTBM
MSGCECRPGSGGANAGPQMRTQTNGCEHRTVVTNAGPMLRVQAHCYERSPAVASIGPPSRTQALRCECRPTVVNVSQRLRMLVNECEWHYIQWLCILNCLLPTHMVPSSVPLRGTLGKCFLL